jgi:heterodisulfide reductase subunit C
MFLFALGQRKMFTRPISGIFHLFIYAAFIITQIELVEVIIDGILGRHRFFAPYLGSFYTFVINLIEILSLLALIATLVFLFRRNILNIVRFRKPELKGWPSRDANMILIGEILLIIGIFAMNGAEQVLQKIDPIHYSSTGTFYLSSYFLGDIFQPISPSLLIVVERFGWWLHYLVVLAFVAYLPFSKHLHIFLAFPNAFYSAIENRGRIQNIPVIENEVRSMLGLQEKDQVTAVDSFGVKDIPDFSWITILQAYSCTECGRCTSVCPANLTGKKLSPRKIIMDIRDRAEEIGRNMNAKLHMVNGQYDDGKSLFDYITKEEIYACTSCNACVEACPILINPLEPIIELRRHDILMNSGGPAEWLPMFNSLENNQSVWTMSDSRTAWINSEKNI